MSKISRCFRRLRHSSTLPWRSTCGAIICLVVLYILQASASFPEVVNNHVEDQVSVMGGIIAEGGGGREDRALDIIGALDHTEPGEVDIAAGSGVSTFYSYTLELRNLASSKLPFAKSLSRRALSDAPPAPPSPTPAPAPTPGKATHPPTPAPAPAKATPPPTPALAPVKATPSPTPAPAPVKATPLSAPRNATHPPTPAPAPANATSSPTPAPTPVPQRPPTPSPAPSPTSGNSEPPSSSRGLNSKTVAGISLVVVGGVLFALFAALVYFVSKRVRGKERNV